MPVQLNVERTTYSRTNTSGQVDIFAVSAPDAILSFSGCPNLPEGEILMIGDGTGKFYKSVSIDTPFTLPSFITVKAVRVGDSPTSINSNLVDLIKITKAEYDIDSSTLTINAESSDKLSPPVLTAVGFGNLVAGSLVAGVSVPPANITVTSFAGGTAKSPVNFINSAAATFAISGTITFVPEDGGTPAAGITVILSGNNITRVTSTDENGLYIFTGLKNGSYTITPTKSGYSFSSTNLTVLVDGNNVSNQNFTKTLLRVFSISGTITVIGTEAPMANVPVFFNRTC